MFSQQQDRIEIFFFNKKSLDMNNAGKKMGCRWDTVRSGIWSFHSRPCRSPTRWSCLRLMSRCHHWWSGPPWICCSTFVSSFVMSSVTIFADGEENNLKSPDHLSTWDPWRTRPHFTKSLHSKMTIDLGNGLRILELWKKITLPNFHESWKTLARNVSK